MATYLAMSDLCRLVLDPVAKAFGPLNLSYGFASRDLTRLIKGRIAPSLDQHAGHEVTPMGTPICPRLGQAVDFSITGMPADEIARFIVSQTAFDRLYFYGNDRPVHVSVGPEEARAVVKMIEVAGRRMPRRVSADQL